MRLINTKTIQLEDLGYSDIPRYAILSHCWRDGEVSYQEILSGSGKDKPGFHKIKRACRLALSRKCGYIWIDTCCIDKTSSAELTEAINSMFKYYQDAYECYAYLDDCAVADDFHARVKACRWWQRGWTLQELIAPRIVLFFDFDWQRIGSKLEHARAADIHAICNVPLDILLSTAPVNDYSVAARMSWAASRVTTRIEDIAYCLFGLFDISMPLIYGEGAKAFRRLQEEIIQRDNDLTIFAGVNIADESNIFAQEPAAFKDMADIASRRTRNHDFSVTNKGIRFAGKTSLNAYYQNCPDSPENEFLVLWLGMKRGGNSIGMRLEKIGPRLLSRHRAMALISFHEANLHEATVPLVYVTDMYISTSTIRNKNLQWNGFRRQAIHVPRSLPFRPIAAVPESLWDIESQSFLHYNAAGSRVHDIVLAIQLRSEGGADILVIVDCRKDDPKPYIMSVKSMEHARFKAELWNALFQQSTKEDSCSWPDLEMRVPEDRALGDFMTTRANVGNQGLKIDLPYHDGNTRYELAIELGRRF